LGSIIGNLQWGIPMKIDRLLGITIYLLNHGRVNAKVFTERFEVSIRTIQRDIDTLCRAGIPIVSTCGTNGGYEIIDSFKMDRQVAGQIDYSFIITALQGLASAYENPMIKATLEKMVSLSPNQNSKAHLFLDFSVLKEGQETHRQLKILEKAILSRQIISFKYTDAEDRTSTPKVEPIALTYKWYAWYLLAFSPKKDDYRMYKLIRMENIYLTNQMGTHTHESTDILLKQWEFKDTRNYIDIRILCKAETKIRAIEYLNGVVESQKQNGDFILRLHLPENEQLWFGSLLSLGNSVEIIEPESLKIRLCQKCSGILHLYKNL